MHAERRVLVPRVDLRDETIKLAERRSLMSDREKERYIKGVMDDLRENTNSDLSTRREIAYMLRQGLGIPPRSRKKVQA